MFDLFAQATPAALRDIVVAIYFLVGVVIACFIWYNFLLRWFRDWF